MSTIPTWGAVLDRARQVGEMAVGAMAHRSDGPASRT